MVLGRPPQAAGRSPSWSSRWVQGFVQAGFVSADEELTRTYLGLTKPSFFRTIDRTHEDARKRIFEGESLDQVFEATWGANVNIADRRIQTSGRILAWLNIVTTFLALAPAVGAFIALVSEHPNLARQLDIVGLITLVVTKGGLWLLTALLIPAAQHLPWWVGGGVVSHYVQRWLKSRERKREPVEKK